MSKVPPHSQEAERALLAHLVTSPDSIEKFVERLKPESFYVPKNQIIYRNLIEMSGAKETIDLTILADRLSGKVPASYIGSLVDGMLKSGDKQLDAYFRLIVEKAQLREIINKATCLIDTAYKGDVGETVGALSDLGEEMDFAAKQQTIASKVKDWVSVTSGDFSVTQIYRELHLVTKQELGAARMALHRLAKEGGIEKSGGRDGVYRRPDKECEPIDFVNAPTEELPVKWPLEIERFVSLYPKNIAVIAGRSNAGKSAALLNLAYLNQKTFPVHYYSSEMGGSEAKLRLSKWEDGEGNPIPLTEWNFKLWDRSSHFADVIDPDALNIIDYLEALDGEEYKVKAYISQIWNKLNKGIAAIALQKNSGRDIGRGGEATLDRARLYLAIDEGLIKIVKAKNWKGENNPNGLARTFKLVQGWKFIPTMDWSRPEDIENFKDYNKPMFEKFGGKRK